MRVRARSSARSAIISAMPKKAWKGMPGEQLQHPHHVARPVRPRVHAHDRPEEDQADQRGSAPSSRCVPAVDSIRKSKSGREVQRVQARDEQRDREGGMGDRSACTGCAAAPRSSSRGPLRPRPADGQRAQRQRHRRAEQQQDRGEHADHHVLHHVHAEHAPCRSRSARCTSRGTTVSTPSDEGDGPARPASASPRRPSRTTPQPYSGERQQAADEEERVAGELQPAAQRERRQVHRHAVSAVIHPHSPALHRSARTSVDPPDPTARGTPVSCVPAPVAAPGAPGGGNGSGGLRSPRRSARRAAPRTSGRRSAAARSHRGPASAAGPRSAGCGPARGRACTCRRPCRCTRPRCRRRCRCPCRAAPGRTGGRVGPEVGDALVVLEAGQLRQAQLRVDVGRARRRRTARPRRAWRPRRAGRGPARARRGR